jgi:hypothetical protein
MNDKFSLNVLTLLHTQVRILINNNKKFETEYYRCTKMELVTWPKKEPEFDYRSFHLEARPIVWGKKIGCSTFNSMIGVIAYLKGLSYEDTFDSLIVSCHKRVQLNLSHTFLCFCSRPMIKKKIGVKKMFWLLVFLINITSNLWSFLVITKALFT